MTHHPLLTLLSGAAKAGPPPSTSPALIFGYKFDEASGNGLDVLGINPLTPGGSPLPVGTTGHIGAHSRAVIAADSQNMSAIDQANLRLANNQTFTLFGWFDPATVRTSDLVAKTDGTNPEYVLNTNSDNSLTFTKYASAAAGSPTAVTASTFGPLPTGSWAFIWIEYDGAYLYAGINGGPKNRIFCTTPVYSGTGTLFFGGIATLFADGAMDEWFCYSPAQTPDMLLPLFNAGAGVAYPFTGVTAGTKAPTVILDKFLFGDSFYTFQPQPYITPSGLWRMNYVYDTGGQQVAPWTTKQATSPDGINWTFEKNLETSSLVQFQLSNPPYILPNGDVIRSNHQSSDLTTYINIQYRSLDSGETWSGGTTNIDASNGYTQANVAYGQVRQVPSNPTRFLTTAYGWNTGDNTAFNRSGIFKTDDNAATWQLLATVGGNGSTIDVNEADIINTGGSNWCFYARSDHGAGWVAFSTDNCATWTTAVNTSFGIQAPWLIYGPDGLLYLFYTSISPERICYRTSSDGGHTLSPECPLINGTTNGRYEGIILHNNAFYVYYSTTDGVTDGFRVGSTGFSIRLCILSFDGSPLLLSASSISGGMNLSWTAFQKGSIYTVMRGTAPGAENVQVYQGANLSAPDSGLTNGTTYYYTVTSGSVSSPEIAVAAGPPISDRIKAKSTAIYNMDAAAGAIEPDALSGTYPLTPVNSPGSAAGYIGNSRSLVHASQNYLHNDSLPSTNNGIWEFNFWLMYQGVQGTFASQCSIPGGSTTGAEWRLAVFGGNLAFLINAIPEIDVPQLVLNQSASVWTHLSVGYDGTNAFMIINNTEKYTQAGTPAKGNSVIVPFAMGANTYSSGDWPTCRYDTSVMAIGSNYTTEERNFLYNDRKGRSFNNGTQAFV